MKDMIFLSNTHLGSLDRSSVFWVAFTTSLGRQVTLFNIRPSKNAVEAFMLSLKSKHFNCSMPVLECFSCRIVFLLVQVQRPLIGTQVQTFQKCKTMSTGKMALVNWLLLVLPHFPSYVRLALDQSLPGPTCGAGSVDLITDRNGEVYKVRFMTHTYIFLYICKPKQVHNCLEEKWQQMFMHFLIFVTFPALVLLGVPFLRISTKDLCVTLTWCCHTQPN